MLSGHRSSLSHRRPGAVGAGSLRRVTARLLAFGSSRWERGDCESASGTAVLRTLTQPTGLRSRAARWKPHIEKHEPWWMSLWPRRFEKRKPSVITHFAHEVGNREANAFIPGVCLREGRELLSRRALRIYNLPPDRTAPQLSDSPPWFPRTHSIKPFGLTFKALHGHVSRPLSLLSSQGRPRFSVY